MVNITMLCANRPRLLKQALDSIGDLSNATVMIRDAGMNEEVREISNHWSRAVNKTRYCTEMYYDDGEKIGTGPARNQVVKNSENMFSRGDYLYLSDDDVYFKRPDWLEILTLALQASYSDGFRVIGCYGHPFNRPIDGTGYTHLERVGESFRVHPIYALATQSMLMDWDTWDEFGPFCDTPAGKVCQSEDVDFSNKIRAAGYKVGVVSPALLVNTGITNSFGEKIPGWEMVKSQAPQGVIVE